MSDEVGVNFFGAGPGARARALTLGPLSPLPPGQQERGRLAGELRWVREVGMIGTFLD